MRGSIISIVACVLAVVACDARAQSGREFANAVNLAGRQRMLSQKMSKEFALLALGVDVDDQQTALRATIDLFETSLAKLQSGDTAAGIPVPPDEAIRSQWKQVRELWRVFKELLETARTLEEIDRATLEQVAAQNLALLQETNKAVQLYLAAAGKAGVEVTSSVVDIAGRQRMLSQKMSKEVLWIALGIDAEAQRTALAATRALFVRSHDGLIAGDEELGLPATADEEILRQMRQVSRLWQEFSGLLDTALAGDLGPDLLQSLARLNLTLLHEMNRAVQMYAGLAES